MFVLPCRGYARVDVVILFHAQRNVLRNNNSVDVAQPNAFDALWFNKILVEPKRRVNVRLPCGKVRIRPQLVYSQQVISYLNEGVSSGVKKLRLWRPPVDAGGWLGARNTDFRLSYFDIPPVRKLLLHLLVEQSDNCSVPLRAFKNQFAERL